ncbi:hypothetical protein ACQ4WX_23270 [Streptomyces lasalocidi]
MRRAVYEDDPKTDAGARTIALDSDTVQAGSSPRRTARCSISPTSPGASWSCTRRSVSRR